MERWQSDLAAGRLDRAWDGFLERYRALVFATIRRIVEDHDEVMDAFTHVCERIREDGFRRLKAYSATEDTRARFGTWLVVVVRNLTIDWIRARRGRRRAPEAVDALPALQRSIFEEVFIRGRGHVEVYEVLRSRIGPDLTFGKYLKELASTHRALLGTPTHASDQVAPDDDVIYAAVDEAHRATVRRHLDRALSDLTPEDRAALLVYVIDDLPAAEAARLLGLPGPKAVYNRVYRALKAVRATLEGAGLSRDDL